MDVFEVLDTEQKISNYMNDLVKEADNIFEIPACTLRNLLFKYKWNITTILDDYDNCEDKDDFFHNAQIVNPFTVDNPRDNTDDEIIDCEICCFEYKSSRMTGLGCGHRFCTQCWGEYLKNKIMEEGLGQSITCPAFKCDILVDDATVMRLVTDHRIQNKYQHLIINSFVKCHRLLRWCPSADCTYAIKALHVEAKPVKCKCGHTFCFECGENWHDPVPCRLFKKWIKKCQDYSETSNCIAANTKECPKCKITIEKNKGCNHMICKAENCKYEFCWMCLDRWELHDSLLYNCNRYVPDNTSTDSVIIKGNLLKRYLHYYSRYMNHMQSLKFEQKLYETINTKMEEMQQHNMSWIEVQYLNQAIDILCQCRQTLMFTYVFVYYLKKNNQVIIFEDNQSDLELMTEKLSEYLDNDEKEQIFDEVRTDTINIIEYCDKRRNILLNHLHEGYEYDYWEYQE